MKKNIFKQWITGIISGKRWGIMGIILSIFHITIFILIKILYDTGFYYDSENTKSIPYIEFILSQLLYYLMFPLSFFKETSFPVPDIILLVFNSIIWGFGLTSIYIFIKKIFFSKPSSK